MHLIVAVVVIHSKCHFSLFLSILLCWWPVRFLKLTLSHILHSSAFLKAQFYLFQLFYFSFFSILYIIFFCSTVSSAVIAKTCIIFSNVKVQGVVRHTILCALPLQNSRYSVFLNRKNFQTGYYKASDRNAKILIKKSSPSLSIFLITAFAVDFLGTHPKLV